MASTGSVVPELYVRVYGVKKAFIELRDEMYFFAINDINWGHFCKKAFYSVNGLV